MVEDGLPHETPEVLPVGSAFSPQVLALAALVFAVLLVALLTFFNRRKSGARGNSFLLLGPSDSGKTAIFSKLVYAQTPPTHTSLQTNASILTLSTSKTIRIVDVPGHPRIRGQFVEYLPDANTIAFVVDSSTISRNGPAVAEHLHHVLHAITSLPPSQSIPPLAIVCNKADLLKTSSTSGSSEALAINRVKTILERELEKRRSAQSGGVGVEGLGEEGERSEMGGLECGDDNAPFKFDNWEGGEIAFLGTAVQPSSEKIEIEKDEDKGGLAPLEDWLEELV